MFNNQKFLTRGVMAELPSWLTNLMWHMVLTMEIEEKRLPAGIQADKNTNGSAHRPRAGATAVPL